MPEITIGTVVRSFDFPATNRDLDGDRACYVVGVVRDIGNMWGDCRRYRIDPLVRVWCGKVKHAPVSAPIYPPENGVKIAGSEGRVCDGVEALT